MPSLDAVAFATSTATSASVDWRATAAARAGFEGDQRAFVAAEVAIGPSLAAGTFATAAS